MSFQVQPAPRMTNAPMKNSRSIHGSDLRSLAIAAAMAADHQQGSSSSQEPIGRSNRASRKKGRDQAGARESTQLPIESATGSPVPCRGDGTAVQRWRTLPLIVSNVLLRPFTERISGVLLEPSASLNDGAAVGPPCGCAAAWQTTFCICCERA